MLEIAEKQRPWKWSDALPYLATLAMFALVFFGLYAHGENRKEEAAVRKKLAAFHEARTRCLTARAMLGSPDRLEAACYRDVFSKKTPLSEAVKQCSFTVEQCDLTSPSFKPE